MNGPVASGTSGSVAREPRRRSGGALRVSATRTRAPRAREMAREREPGEPEAEHDGVAARVVASSAQLQRRETEQHEQHRDDPEAHDDLVLLPALQLVVVVDRRHPEDALAGELERRHLDHHRQRLDDEHAAHDEQHDLLAHDHGDRAERGAERERADVAHEHLGRIGVEPEEAQARAGDRAADHRELAGARDVAETAGSARRSRCR